MSVFRQNQFSAAMNLPKASVHQAAPTPPPKKNSLWGDLDDLDDFVPDNSMQSQSEKFLSHFGTSDGRLVPSWGRGNRGLKQFRYAFEGDTFYIDMVENAERGAFRKLWPELTSYLKNNGIKRMRLADHSYGSDKDVWGGYGFSGKKHDESRWLDL
jgi:hypothetical protein